MSEATTAPATATEQDTSIPAANTATPAAPAVPSEDTPWLKARLERAADTAAKKILSDLGVADVKDARAALKAHKDAQDAAKSEAQKQAERIAALEPAAKRAAEIEAEIAAEMAAELESLDEAKRNAVKAAAGDDPVAQRRVLRALRPTWVTAAAPAAAPAVPAKPIAAPASTTAAAPAPAPTAPTSENVLATYEALRLKDPAKAAAYQLAHLGEYLAAKRARG